jgi:hypothetical protein
MTDRNYGGVVWTNHALARLKERGIKQSDAWAAWRRPDNSKYSKSRGGWIYERTFGNTKTEVVAKINDKDQWVILSVWSSPVIHRQQKSVAKIKITTFLQKISKFFKLTNIVL